MERDYYTLKRAAEILKCSEDDLIYLGSKEVIRIGVVVGNGITLKQVIDSKTARIVDERIGPFPGTSVKLDPYCVKDYEAGIEDTEVILALYPKGRPDGNAEVIKIVDKNTGQPLLIKNSKLVIYTEDLKQLQQSKNQPQAKDRPSCGTKAIHKLIDSAYYFCINTETPIPDKNQVFKAIKNEFELAEDPRFDVSIIREIDKERTIHWYSQGKKPDSPHKFKTFGGHIKSLNNLNKES